MLASKKAVALEEGWNRMQKGIQKVKDALEGKPDSAWTSKEWMEQYTSVYDMCTQKPPHDYSLQLYERYKLVFTAYIDSVVSPSLRDKHDQFLLKELNKRWANHNVLVRWMSRFFNYLDRYFVKRHNLAELKEVGLVTFREMVYKDEKKRASDAVLALVLKERDGELVDRALLKETLSFFVEIGMGSNSCYESDFEKALLEDTAKYYQREALSWIDSDSCPEYMIKAEDCLKREKERVEHYLHSGTEPKLLKEAENALLVVHEQRLLEKEHSGCQALLRDDKKDDLARMFRLFIRVPSSPTSGLPPVAEMFKKHVEGEGMGHVKAAEATAAKRKDMKKGEAAGGMWEHVFVRALLALHDKYLDYVGTCFANHSVFHKALKDAFEVFCNKQVAGMTTAELLASFCDQLLKKGSSEKLDEEAIESTLEKVVRLLAYIQDKDMFSEFYRKKLSRRLLNDRSAYDEAERSILSKLKQQCGAQFTSKLEGMVTDLTVGREKQQLFETWMKEKSRALALDMSVTVLTTGYWPTYKFIELRLPKEMVAGVDAYKEFFATVSENKKLTWIHSLGSCQLATSSDKWKGELHVMPFQAALLLLFNEADTLSYAEIKDALNLPDEDLVRSLHSLSCARYVLLNKSPEGQSISETDSFSFNRNFVDKMRRLKLPMPPVEDKKVVQEVEKDRKFAIDASIVRIMKSRKTLPHQQLVLECVSQLSRMFKPDFKVIKMRIEDLISREYLERDKENASIFRYLA